MLTERKGKKKIDEQQKADILFQRNRVIREWKERNQSQHSQHKWRFEAYWMKKRRIWWGARRWGEAKLDKEKKNYKGYFIPKNNTQTKNVCVGLVWVKSYFLLSFTGPSIFLVLECVLRLMPSVFHSYGTNSECDGFIPFLIWCFRIELFTIQWREM